MDCLKTCSGQKQNVPGYVPGTQNRKPAPIGRCSVCSGCTHRVFHTPARAHEKPQTTTQRASREQSSGYTQNTRNIQVKTGLSESQYPAHNPEPNAQTRNMTEKPLRQAMPFTSAIIDDFRANFPEAGVVQAVRAGIDGQPVFYVSENGHQIGTPIPYAPNKAVRLSDIDRTPNTLTSAPQTEKKGNRRG